MFEFWLKNEVEGINLLLPITPPEYIAEYGREIEVIRSMDQGDINLSGHKIPQSISISSFFPTREYIFGKKPTVGVSGVMDYTHLIKKWIDDDSIIRLVIADEKGARVNERFKIQSIKYGEKREDNGDIPYTIELRQYTPLNIAAVQTSPVQNAARPQDKQPPKPKQYTVAKGDSLSKIARKVYGDASKWPKIYEANKSMIGKNPNLIFPGQVYVLP
ncbi:LysM peptidoglycan-binding domain-containing protein [Anaerotignum sp. MB30-C6]|uniref:LysM peptidoglycan-binding domain-containing protein n=1 Tax=Anaerotignum sp. MB30-C6 TaxID=3070814 RepID=UPI0027DD1702|nr:LysM peptidoglycan-binding domain-containing protein [Anaerotignum sp. MB30-C6]WMI81602.1 LysM peptidoglycan-binding domain-containing protein [Anaerotignum sp. MB30-C6]